MLTKPQKVLQRIFCQDLQGLTRTLRGFARHASVRDSLSAHCFDFFFFSRRMHAGSSPCDGSLLRLERLVESAAGGLVVDQPVTLFTLHTTIDCAITSFAKFQPDDGTVLVHCTLLPFAPAARWRRLNHQQETQAGTSRRGQLI